LGIQERLAWDMARLEKVVRSLETERRRFTADDVITISFYMRNLRAVYNRAVEKGLTLQNNPFRHVYTGVDKTVKRAIPIKAIKALL